MKGINKDGKKIAVIGSRDFTDRQKLYSILSSNRDKIKIIVSGGARGADTLATNWASDNGVPYLVFPAKWHDPETGEFDKGAGFKRNWQIVEYCDSLLAFWDGVSAGTKNSLDIAEQLGKKTTVVLFEPKPITSFEEASPVDLRKPRKPRTKKESQEEVKKESSIETKAEPVVQEAPLMVEPVHESLLPYDLVVQPPEPPQDSQETL